MDTVDIPDYRICIRYLHETPSTGFDPVGVQILVNGEEIMAWFGMTFDELEAYVNGMVAMIEARTHETCAIFREHEYEDEEGNWT